MSAESANATGPGVVMIGAGDIGSCSSSSNDEGTANLIDSLVQEHPNATVFPVGDVVYDRGTASEFQNCYNPTWGRFKSRTRPAVGNHEYETSGAKGYFDYFNGVGNTSGPAGDRGKGYYSYDVGKWHVVVLNSNNSFVPSKGGSAQDNWLKADLAATSQPCIMAYWHHARFASSRTSPLPSPPSYTLAFWNALYNAGADLIVVGHQHFYERFAPQDPSGNADPVNGIRQFVVGTGGRSVTPMTVIRQNSQVMNGNTFGVIKLTLRDGTYDWEFIPVKGKTFRDSGSGNCKGSSIPGPNEPPTASFNHSCNGLDCTFTGTSSDPDGTIVARVWDFGDGATSTDSPASHTYASGGSYTVRLTVTDNDGATGTTTKVINVSAPNQSPTAAFSHTCEGLSCSFTDGSTDPDGTIDTWSWEFGDGGTSTQQHPTHTYATGPSFTVRLTVTDNDGATHSVTRTVDLNAPSPGPNQDPTASFTHTCNGLACSFTDGSNDTDGTITARSWDFGDGSSATGLNPSHTYASGGSYTVRLTVTDNDGGTGTTTRTVTASAPAPGPNQNPTANFNRACTGPSCVFTDTSTDPDGTVTAWSWQFGDGGTSTQQHPTHDYARGGTYTIRLTVTDNRQGTASVSKVETIITITAAGRIANGARVVDLTWVGAKGSNVDIRRNGVKIVTTANDGAHTDNVGGSGSATHQYRVCNAGSTTVCSAVATVQF